MITAIEKGRNLVLTVGDDEDSIVFVVPPVSAKIGSALFALWVGILFGTYDADEVEAGKPEEDAGNMSKLAVGEANWGKLDELRWAESEAVINAAIFWNIQGGGIDLVNDMLTGGYPKARQTLCERSGLGAKYSLLQTLLSGASESLTLAPVGTPDTTTPIGTSGSFGTQREPRIPDKA